MLLQYFKLATQLFHWHIFFGRACDMVDVDIFMSDNILLGVSSSVCRSSTRVTLIHYQLKKHGFKFLKNSSVLDLGYKIRYLTIKCVYHTIVQLNFSGKCSVLTGFLQRQDFFRQLVICESLILKTRLSVNFETSSNELIFMFRHRIYESNLLFICCAKARS